MTTIVARVPQVDFSLGFNRHWYDDNPAITHVFNALSFLFPQGEQFFIDVVREVAGDMDMTVNPALSTAVKGFIAQESTHRHLHAQYNSILQKQGYDNAAYNYIERTIAHSQRNFSALTKLAIVCGYEHYTAVLGDFILSNPHILEAATSEMALIWGWHSAEETEHKAVCFDLYKAAGGGWLRRILMFSLMSFNFMIIVSRIYLSLLTKDSCLKPKLIGKNTFQYLQFMFGSSGVVWHIFGNAVRYFSPSFHPWDEDNHAKLQSWFAANEDRMRLVGGALG